MQDHEYKTRYPEAWNKGEQAAKQWSGPVVNPYPLSTNEAVAFDKGLFWTRQEMQWLEQQERRASAMPVWAVEE